MNIDLKDADRIPDGLVEWPLPIERVLYEAEQPIVFLSKNAKRQLMLAYLANEDQDATFTILTPISWAQVRNLEAGVVSVREALTSSWMWLVRHEHRQPGADVWAVAEADIPQQYLPRHGTPLLPEHSIVFAARALGDDVSLGRMPCSVVSFVADATRSALKAMLDHLTAANTEGRPTDARRALYDLPVQRLGFASFEIGLSEPNAGLFPDDTLHSAVGHLQRGLAWAQNVSDHSELEEGAIGEKEAVLRATLALSPPSSGAITAVEVSGAWLGGKRYHLTRTSRTKVSRSLRNLQRERIVVFQGRIGEIDDDNLSFTLREADDNVDHKGAFPESLLEDMRTHYYEANKVEISGVERNGRLRVTAVVPLTAPESGDAEETSEP